MSHQAADIFEFIAFSAVWLFPVALLVAVLGFSSADARARRDDPGPNIIPFPIRVPPAKANWLSRLMRLAFRRLRD